MAEHLITRPAYEPITTKGNQFFRGDKRFLIKGINYLKRQSPEPGRAAHCRDPTIDCLDDEHLAELERDIKLLHELDLNTLLVTGLDHRKSHDKALKLLADNGFYVVLHVGHFIYQNLPRNVVNDPPDFSLHDHYTPANIEPDLKLIAQLAPHPNLLGIMVSGSSINTAQRTRNAELVRALIRDIKTFLTLRSSRPIPIGVSFPDVVMHRLPALQYFSAGPPSCRADFFGLECYSWAQESSFQISGWKNLVEQFEEFPIPMFLSRFGAYIWDRQRIWQEVGCLFSTDMTGVFSGGAVQCFVEYGDGYGVVEVGEDGGLRRKPEFETLKERFRAVGSRREEEVLAPSWKDYEGWTGDFPKMDKGMWNASSELPALEIDWPSFISGLEGLRL